MFISDRRWCRNERRDLVQGDRAVLHDKGVGKGTGLGLSMVHGMTEQSGGCLVLKSEVGKGTTAEIWLPAANPAKSQVSQTSKEEAVLGERPLTIVAVDDDALVLMNTAAMLEDLGHKVFAAPSGKAALEIVRREPSIDVIVTDQAMPRMTGTQLAALIQAERPETPIILATGYADLPRGEASNIPRLPKPFTQEEIAQAVARAATPPNTRGPAT